MDEARIPLDVKAVLDECPQEGIHPAPDSPAYRTAAESQHGDATDARQILRRLLGWNLDENERNSLRQALEVIDRIDSRACRTMRDDWTAARLP